MTIASFVCLLSLTIIIQMKHRQDIEKSVTESTSGQILKLRISTPAALMFDLWLMNVCKITVKNVSISNKVMVVQSKTRAKVQLILNPQFSFSFSGIQISLFLFSFTSYPYFFEITLEEIKWEKNYFGYMTHRSQSPAPLHGDLIYGNIRHGIHSI
jgi:hypothetical protein